MEYGVQPDKCNFEIEIENLSKSSSQIIKLQIHVLFPGVSETSGMHTQHPIFKGGEQLSL